MFEEDDRVVALQGVGEEPLGVVRGRRGHHAKAGEVGEHRVVVARVVGRRRVADSDAAPQQDRHLDPSRRHVLNLGDLVDDLADAVEAEVGEHEINHWSRAGHGRPSRESGESSLGDRRVAEPDRAVQVEEARCGHEVPAALADPLAKHKDAGVAFHGVGQGFPGGLGVSRLPRAVSGRSGLGDRFRLGVNMRRG